MLSPWSSLGEMAKEEAMVWKPYVAIKKKKKRHTPRSSKIHLSQNVPASFLLLGSVRAFLK